MKILAIETSCDETAAAIVEKTKTDKQAKVISSVISSSLPLHSATGGIIPENAAREQIKLILPVLAKTLIDANLSKENPEIDAISVTIGPGLIGSLLVGVETAKALAFAWNKPVIPVNHLFGHIYANFVGEIPNPKSEIAKKEIEFPAIVLVVSGGHTDLLLMQSHKKITWLGGTRDDAAGEAFDKIGRLLQLPYPGGPNIEKEAKNGNEKKYNFPRPLWDSNDFDFSFSGLKTAALREVKDRKLSKQSVRDISAAVQKSIIDVLVKKTLLAVKKYNAKSVLISGGVAANGELRRKFEAEIKNLKLEVPFFVPEKWLCTDNAAMIGAAAIFNAKIQEWKKIEAKPNLYFENA